MAWGVLILEQREREGEEGGLEVMKTTPKRTGASLFVDVQDRQDRQFVEGRYRESLLVEEEKQMRPSKSR